MKKKRYHRKRNGNFTFKIELIRNVDDELASSSHSL